LHEKHLFKSLKKKENPKKKNLLGKSFFTTRAFISWNRLSCFCVVFCGNVNKLDG
jgi:hypothetical protein